MEECTSFGPLLPAKFCQNWCNESNLWGESPDFGALSNCNTPLALRAGGNKDAGAGIAGVGSAVQKRAGGRQSMAADKCRA